MKGTAKREKIKADCGEWEREVLLQVERELQTHAGVALAGAKNILRICADNACTSQRYLL